MVRRWSASAAVDWRLASRLLDARHHATAIPVLQVLPSEWILMLQDFMDAWTCCERPAACQTTSLIVCLPAEPPCMRLPDLCSGCAVSCDRSRTVPSRPTEPASQVAVEASALLVRCDTHAAQTLLSLAAGCANYLQFYAYRRARPQVPTAGCEYLKRLDETRPIDNCLGVYELCW